MVDWLVITSDKPGAGRGVRGYALVWFLQTYFGRWRVANRTPRQARTGVGRCDTFWLGLPTSLTPGEIQRLVDQSRPRRLVLFDYLDHPELAWTPEQEHVLRKLTDRYFKPWFETAWSYDLKMGMLPLRTNPRLYFAIAWNRMMRKVRRPSAVAHDVAFLGRPNRTGMLVDGAFRKVEQRLNWLRELKREAPDISFRGGFTDWDEPEFREQYVHRELDALRHERYSLSFPAYWRTLQSARVLLSPGGNAPWTYRHYECLYAGGVVVTIDFRQRDMLVPLPCEGMIHAPDEAPVVPFVRQALELSRRRPEVAEENFAHLERYLHYGCFSRSRPALLERFLAQLN